MQRVIEEFSFVNALQNRVNDIGKFELTKYQRILAQLERDMEGLGAAEEEKAPAEQPAGAEAPAEKEAEEPPEKAFLDRLSPIGRLSYDMLLERENSYRALTAKWLDSVGLRGDWGVPFQAPINQAFKLGLEEMEQLLARNWNEELKPEIEPLLAKFPFNRKSEKTAQPVELEEVLIPYGRFWQKFRRLAEPMFTKVHGVIYRPRAPSIRPMQLPVGMLVTANRLSMLTHTLWDEKGDPKPLKLRVKSQPLPRAKVAGAEVVLAFLSADKASVFGFNQAPSFKDIEVVWWKEVSATAGIQLMDEEMRKSQPALSVPETSWSFFRLLQLGVQGANYGWTWMVPTKEKGGTTVNIQFQFDGDPFGLFRIGNL